MVLAHLPRSCAARRQPRGVAPRRDGALSLGDRVRDELAIRNLVARYAGAVNRRDAEAWGATWTDDGVWHLFGRELRGREALVEFWRGAMSSFRFVVQLVHAGEVEVGDAVATGRWTLSELGETAGGARTLTVGVYHDEYARTAEGWRFACRRFGVLYGGPPDLSGAHFSYPFA